MIECSKLYTIKTVSPLHAGSGEDLSVVDMPIQREKHTGFPKIESSGLKGALREAFTRKIDLENKEKEKEKLNTLFGPNTGNKAYAGALGFSDARLLFFPVKSMKGIFAWISCPMVIKRYLEDLSYTLGKKAKDKTEEEIRRLFEFYSSCSSMLEEDSCIVSKDSKDSKVVFTNQENKKFVFLEEYCFEVKKIEKEKKDKLGELFKFLLIEPNPNSEPERTKIEEYTKEYKEKLKQKLVLVSDDTFKDFVLLSTEVITRNKIDSETGTAEEGGLWTEEYLPAESFLYFLALGTKPNKKEEDLKTATAVLKKFDKEIEKQQVFQIGGNANIGKGICKIFSYKGSNEQNPGEENHE